MGEEFYAAIKLVSGEEIFSLVSEDENDGDIVLILQNPVVMKIIHSSTGMYVKIKPWMDLPEDDFYIIKYDKIITMTEIKNDMMIQFYEKFITDEDNLIDHRSNVSNQVKLSDKMGYLSSVEDARKTLEKLYKDIKEN